jgi:uncharacterized membrane protein YeiB
MTLQGPSTPLRGLGSEPGVVRPLGSSVERGGRAVAQRVGGVDLARAVAMLGMLIAHYAQAEAPNSALQALRGSVDGRAMPLFVLLGGVGFSMLTARSAHPDRDVLRRAAVLFPLGLVLVEHVPYIAVIVHFYAVFFLAGALVRRLPDTWLLGVAALVGVAGGITYQLWGSTWPWYGGFEGWSVDLEHLPADLFFVGAYPFLPTFAFFALGMWLGRRRLANPATQLRMLVAGLAMAAVGQSVAAIHDHTALIRQDIIEQHGVVSDLSSDAKQFFADTYGVLLSDIDALIDEEAVAAGMTRKQVIADGMAQYELMDGDVDVPSLAVGTGHSHMPAWVLAASGWATAILGACLIAARRLPTLTAPFVTAGTMALTFYVAHGLALRWLPEEWFESYGQNLILVAVTYIGFVLAANLWAMRFSHGPLESVLRFVAGQRGSGRKRLVREAYSA